MITKTILDGMQGPEEKKKLYKKTSRWKTSQLLVETKLPVGHKMEPTVTTITIQMTIGQQIIQRTMLINSITSKMKRTTSQVITMQTSRKKDHMVKGTLQTTTRTPKVRRNMRQLKSIINMAPRVSGITNYLRERPMRHLSIWKLSQV